MKSKKPFRLLAAFICILSACASPGTYIHTALDDVEIKEKNASTRIHTAFFIGSAGASRSGRALPSLIALEEQLKSAGPSSSVVFLGDNILPQGMPKQKDIQRDQAEYALDAQLSILKDYQGRVVFLPGTRDWRQGLKGLERQEEYIEDELDEKNVFLPERGCAGPRLVDLNPDLSLIIIDSEWWLQNWDREPAINAECDVQTREELIRDFTDLLKKNRQKDIIVAFHHTLYSQGPHGGHFSLRDHLFPLSRLVTGLYLPLPVLGSLYPLIRSNAGFKQDQGNPNFRAFKQAILHAARDFENLVFVGGNEHNLQYIEREHPFIVSGSAYRSSAFSRGKDLMFGSSEQGFAAIDQYDDGSLGLRFFKVNSAGNANVIYETEIKSQSQPKPSILFDPIPEDTMVEATIYLPEETERSAFYRWLWGTWYRDIYSTKVEVPLLDLSRIKGGLIPVRRGGGMQTLSLRLEDHEGRHYALRAMRKNVDNLLPSAFANTFVSDMMRDFFTTAHPYAAFVIPDMAEAVGIYHTNPKLYYVPQQPYLGNYNAEFGEGLYLFEERPDDDRQDVASFGRSEEIISSLDLMQRLQKNDHHEVDQQWLVRSRLFDLVISDWDRHDDQWRWAAFEEGRNKVYRPIPRDRDQAFARFDGFLTSLATRTIVNLRPMQRFPERTRKVHWLTWNTRFFDRRFLNDLTWEEWLPEIRTIQQQLTDSVISDALQQWPQEIYAQGGAKISQTLQARRDNLHLMAEDLYGFLARSVDVVGTNKPDYFLIEHEDDQHTRVRVYRNNDRDKDDKIYDRIFKHSETREINIYGLDGKDDFEIKGATVKSPIIRLIGGQDKDDFDDESKDKRWRKSIRIYDDLRNNDVETGPETKDRRSDKRLANEYLFREFKYPYTLAIPYLSYFSDDGIFVGGRITHEIPGFKKEPFGQKHEFDFNYAFITQAFQLQWDGHFKEALGRWDLSGRFLYQTPRYAQNFYGFGNETANTENNDYYRVRKKHFQIKGGFGRSFANGASFFLSPLYEQLKLEKTSDRIVTDPNLALNNALFENQDFAGAHLRFDFKNQNHPVVPNRGMHFHFNLDWRENLKVSRSFLRAETEMTYYQPIGKNGQTVLATEIGAAHIWGSFDLYHATRLGGISSLRGYRIERFTGGSSFYHSTDLRIPLVYFNNNVLPFQFGITGSFDHGRVWHASSTSDRWYYNGGGSIWINIIDAAVLRFGAHQGTEGLRFVGGLGYAF